MKNMDVNGVVLLDKSLHISSNKALQQVKKIFNAKKAGHTGSLDPLASGILPICLGQATKLSQFLLNTNKRYLAAGQLGIKTTTADAEGEVIQSASYHNISKKDIADKLLTFLGNTKQVPPMYSALKYHGKPLYKIAREGGVVNREKRQITIFEINLLSYDDGVFIIDVLCSKGTYIRTLVEDIASSLNCVAFLKSLIRTEFANYNINDAITIDKMQQLKKINVNKLNDIIKPTHDILANYQEALLDKNQAQAIKYGQKINYKNNLKDASIIKLFSDNIFLGIACYKDGIISPKRLFN